MNFEAKKRFAVIRMNGHFNNTVLTLHLEEGRGPHRVAFKRLVLQELDMDAHIRHPALGQRYTY